MGAFLQPYPRVASSSKSLGLTGCNKSLGYHDGSMDGGDQYALPKRSNPMRSTTRAPVLGTITPASLGHVFRCPPGTLPQGPINGQRKCTREAVAEPPCLRRCCCIGPHRMLGRGNGTRWVGVLGRAPRVPAHPRPARCMTPEGREGISGTSPNRAGSWATGAGRHCKGRSRRSQASFLPPVGGNQGSWVSSSVRDDASLTCSSELELRAEHSVRRSKFA